MIPNTAKAASVATIGWPDDSFGFEAGVTARSSLAFPAKPTLRLAIQQGH